MEKEYQSVGNVDLPQDFILKLSIILIYEPMVDKKYKVYKKLDSKQKAGMIMRHIMSVSKKYYGANDAFLSIVVELREDYTFWKRMYKQDVLAIKKGETNVKILVEGVKTDAKYNMSKMNLIWISQKLIKRILNNKEFKQHMKATNEKES